MRFDHFSCWVRRASGPFFVRPHVCGLVQLISIAALFLLYPSFGQAGCVTNNSMVLCTGTLDAVSYNAASVSELSVRDLTANVPSVTLGGSSSQPIGAPGRVPACSIPNQCSFHRDEITRQVYCQVNANAPANTRCIEQVIQSGPSGMVGPNSSVNVQTSTFSVTPGGVSGSSTGANGANGDNAGLSDATNGAPGVDGGSTNVVVEGAVNTTSGTGGSRRHSFIHWREWR